MNDNQICAYCDKIREDMLKVKRMVAEVELIIGNRESETELVNKLIDAQNLLTYCIIRLKNAIVPPCKVGDTVYIVNTDGDGEVFMEENKIYDVSTTSMFISVTMPISDEILCAEPYEDIGKTVFLTREEAEKALAEREGEG